MANDALDTAELDKLERLLAGPEPALLVDRLAINMKLRSAAPALIAAARERDELLQARGQWLKNNAENLSEKVRFESEAASFRALIAKAIEALRPFADTPHDWEIGAYNKSATIRCNFNAGEIERVRITLSELQSAIQPRSEKP